ncbi:MAG: hypothetical protein IJA00_05205, partial [Bacteroidaceae bacterium]|nr:hypothetical protein [Bacteroidaceae bacterium]
LYAIANLTQAKSDEIAAQTDGAYTQTFANLKDLTFTDADIYEKHTAEAPKLFLMDGYFNNCTTTDLEKNTHQVTVPLRRAAAKVRVNIYKATSWTDENKKEVSIDQDAIKALVKNYATQTKVVAPEDAEDLGETAPEDDYATLSHQKRTTDYTEKTTINEETCTYLTSVLFYTFAHKWGETESLGEETTFIMNLPYTIPDGETESPRPENWYKIVFVPDGGRSYARNTLYDVDVLVAYDGSEESYEPTPVVNPTYKISEWYPEGFNVENTTPVDYLILDRYYIDMRNVADTTITFYSSNTVTVEVVHDVSAETGFVWPADFPNATSYVGDAIDEAQETLLGMGTNNDIADIPGIYYPDKENRRVPIYTSVAGNNTNNSSNISYNTANTFTDLNGAVYKPVTVTSYTGGKANSQYTSAKTNSEVYITWPKDEYSEDGKTINLYSAIPRNATLRFITLKVTMQKKHTTGTITRYVVIKQYPLEYIVNQFGYYSYMDANILNMGDNGEEIEYFNLEMTDNTKNDKLYTLYCADLGTEYGKTDPWIIVPFQVSNGLNGHLSNSGQFKCKFYLDGTAKTNDASNNQTEMHTWEDAEGTHVGVIYQVRNGYTDTDAAEGTPGRATVNGNPVDTKVVGGLTRYDGTDQNDTNEGDINRWDPQIPYRQGLDANTPSNNNRMYEVRVTATSPKYHIGYPKLLKGTYTSKTEATWQDAGLYTDPSEENNQLVSPHFVIASQLGNNPATYYWHVAHDRCLHYVEVDNQGNVFNNWRLPTIAELSIIKDFQLKPDVYNVTMVRVLNSDGEGDPRYWTAGKDIYVDTRGAGGEMTQTYSTTELVSSLENGAFAGEKVYKYTEGVTQKVRVRCVRDIKE